mmetsp:Transcript_29520/g.68413  ORF Transcript_29520/g.68413 Transcript_29520/m.68413 type:complete len:304 (+) Transcript_29520:4509-5420(+)
MSSRCCSKVAPRLMLLRPRPCGRLCTVPSLPATQRPSRSCWATRGPTSTPRLRTRERRRCTWRSQEGRSTSWPHCCSLRGAGCTRLRWRLTRLTCPWGEEATGSRLCILRATSRKLTLPTCFCPRARVWRARHQVESFHSTSPRVRVLRTSCRHSSAPARTELRKTTKGRRQAWLHGTPAPRISLCRRCWLPPCLRPHPPSLQALCCPSSLTQATPKTTMPNISPATAAVPLPPPKRTVILPPPLPSLPQPPSRLLPSLRRATATRPPLLGTRMRQRPPTRAARLAHRRPLLTAERRSSCPNR